MNRLARLVGVVVLVVAAAACSPSPSPSPAASASTGSASVVPVIVSSEQVVGDNRFVFSFLDAKTNSPAARPDRTAKVTFYDLAKDPSKPTATDDGAFVWGIPNVTGLYVTHVTFPNAGDWAADFQTAAPGSAPETIRVTFQVRDKGSAIAVGQPAPATKNPTAADAGGDISKIATDPQPDPDFYRLSVDQAIAQHKPFVLVFATPKFCTSKQCGPTLDMVKPFAKQYPSVAFINVEPYKLEYSNGQLQPVLDPQNQLQPVDAVKQWGIPSEPWIYVVDGAGIVRGSFEGIAGADELRQAISSVAKGT